jgi:iron complex outermembrane recepter protein
MPSKIEKKYLIFNVLASLLITSNVYAAEITKKENSNSDEVIVTAKRKIENLQKSAISVSSVSGKQLEQTGSFNTSKLQQSVPTLQFYSQNQRNTTVNIRGIGAPFGLTNDGIEQGVGFYIDDVYYARAASAALDFVDVAQIEVLRGPQGTLYGKNTTAGAINISTREPSFEKEAKASLTYGNYNFLQFKGSASGALSENVAGRISASLTKRDGLSYNVARQEKVNELDNVSVRGQLVYKPNDDLKIGIFADSSLQNPNGAGQQYVRVAPTLRASVRQYANLATYFNYQIPSTNPFDRLVDHDSKTGGRHGNSGASVRVNYNVAGGELTSVSAFRTWSWRPSNDRDWIGLPITTISANPSDSRQWQQELRFNKSINNHLEYVTGLFYFGQKIRSSGNTALGNSASYWLNGPANTATNNALDATLGHHTASDYASILDGLTQTSDVHLDTQSAAVFGRLTWKATDKLSIEPGLRFNYDNKESYYNALVSGGLQTTNATLKAIQNAQLAPSFYEAQFEDTNVSGDLTASYKLTDNALLYSTYAKTFKSGGINLNGIPNGTNGLPAVNDFGTVAPEDINHFEIGLKTQTLGKKLTLNGAIYRTDIKDYQATVQLAASGSSTLRGVLASVPKVLVQGAELDAKYFINDNLKFSSNIAYTDGKYASFPNAPVALENSGGSIAVSDISGQVLPGISKFSATYSVEYTRDTKLLSQDDKFYFAIDGNTRSKFSSSPTPSAYTWIDGYTLTNLRTGIRTQDNLDFGIWIKNLNDTEYFNQLTVQSGATGLIVGEVGDPRTYGLTISKSF